MNYLRYLLFPFALIYLLITFLRNKLFDSGKWRSAKFSLPLINIGNLSTGGTGKTPHVEYVIRLLQNQYKLATLSRGYGRKTSGFLIANEHSTASEIGDEPAQMAHKFPQLTVSVGENRLLAIPQLLMEHPEIQVILLDDAFQHRFVRPGLNILLTTYENPYFNDKILPIGNLREHSSGSKRADIIIVTKCPSKLTVEEKKNFLDKINPLTHQKVFFSTIVYGHPYSVVSNELVDLRSFKKLNVLTGIANPNPIYDYLNDKQLFFQKIRFADHHRYTKYDVEKIIQKTNEFDKSNAVILTTEKDFMRLRPFMNLFEKKNIQLFALPIEMKILDNEEEFQRHILDFIQYEIRKTSE